MKRARLAAIVAALLVLGAGCVGTLGTDEEIDEEDLLAGIDDVETYEFELTQTMDVGMGEMTVSGVGVADQSAEKLYMETESEMLGRTIDQEVYVVDETTYMKTQGMGMDESWMKVTVPDGEGDGEELWSGQETLASQAEYIEGGDVEEVGTESVNGVETTVVELELTDELRAELESTQDLEGVDVAVESVDYRLYVDESTNYLHKVEIDVTAEQLGRELTIVTEMVITNHNEPVDITLPEAAEDAVDLDEWDDPLGGDDPLDGDD